MEPSLRNYYKQLFSSLTRLMRFRSRLLEGVLLDIRQHYTGSIIGIFWVFLFPFLQLSIFAVLYVMIFKVRPAGLTEWEYVLLVFSGLVPLIAFNSILTAAAGSLIANKNLLLSTVFPAELIPIRSALAAHVPAVAGLIITLILGFILGRTNLYTILLVPLFWILLVLFAVGLGWILSLLTLVAKDIQHILGLMLMLTTILSPFAYTPEMVPQSLKFILYLNPLSYFVLSFQQLILYGTYPDLGPFIGSIFFGLTGFVIGYIVFIKAKFTFFDYA
jgi:lipopolysaccharide transport system permease protein